MFRAVGICKTPLPDLTGDPELQGEALAWNIHFTIRPKADKEIKDYNQHLFIETGSHLPGPQPQLVIVGGIYE